MLTFEKIISLTNTEMKKLIEKEYIDYLSYYILVKYLLFIKRFEIADLFIEKYCIYEEHDIIYIYINLYFGKKKSFKLYFFL
jgi:replicative superfamily II helicase